MPVEQTFTERVKAAIKSIPRGRVATYGLVALQAGNHRAARQVVWVLHSSSGHDRLPWHRVINAKGHIALAPGAGFEEQRRRLLGEGVEVDEQGRIDLARYLWRPRVGS
jgi:methylated-DNA-protein-cysteine methyltransferase related protein